MSDQYIKLQDAIRVRNAMSDYRDKVYLNLIRQIKEKTSEILKDDMGTQFVHNCGRDLAGEVVRTYFDTSDYHITVDQLATRLLEFSYDNEYDPLSDNSEAHKNVYNYNDISSSTLNTIADQLDSSQKKLFEKEEVWDNNKQKTEKKYIDRNLMNQGKEHYAKEQMHTGDSIKDEYTGKDGTRGNPEADNRLEVDHVQSANQATYNARFMKDKGIQELKIMMNSEDNFAMMSKSANASKGDVCVYEKNGKVLSSDDIKIEKEKIAENIKKQTGKEPSKKYINEQFEHNVKNITSRATPDQLADAVCKRWENAGNKQELIDKGYLNDDGKVPKSVRKKLEDNIKHSQNKESKVILKNAKYDEIGKEAAVHTAKKIGKIIAGQVIYYAAPPIIYEARCIMQKKNITIDNAMKKLSSAGKRIGNYVYSHLKDIFKNVATNSLKKFIKSFMDILIGMVKATVKKLLKVIKSLVMAVVDSIRIIANPGTTGSQKADAVFNLFGITVTNVVVELLFEAIEKGTKIPEFLLNPLQILTSVVCTNFTMLVLQKADIFDVRLGFKIDAIKKVFAQEKEVYQYQINGAEQLTDEKVKLILQMAKKECMSIYNDLTTMDTRKQSVHDNLEKVNHMFNIDIDFESAWLKYLGLHPVNP